MIKGVQYVKIPNSGGRCGGRMACALGALAGNAADGMQVFQRVQAEDAAAAEADDRSGSGAHGAEGGRPRLWLRVTVTGSEGTGVAIVQDRHDNVAYLESDGNVLRDTRSAAEAEDAPDYGALSVGNDLGVLHACAAGAAGAGRGSRAAEHGAERRRAAAGIRDADRKER